MSLADATSRTAELERTAAALAARIDSISKRVDSNESSSSSAASSSSSSSSSAVVVSTDAVTLEAFQSSVIEQLQAIKDTVQAEQQDANKLVEENEALREENGKLKYRIKHLLRSLEAAEAKN